MRRRRWRHAWSESSLARGRPERRGGGYLRLGVKVWGLGLPRVWGLNFWGVGLGGFHVRLRAQGSDSTRLR